MIDIIFEYYYRIRLKLFRWSNKRKRKNDDFLAWLEYDETKARAEAQWRNVEMAFANQIVEEQGFPCAGRVYEIDWGKRWMFERNGEYAVKLFGCPIVWRNRPPEPIAPPDPPSTWTGK